MNERKFIIEIVPPQHSMDYWHVDLFYKNLDFALSIAVGENERQAIANAKAALLDALKQLEEK